MVSEIGPGIARTNCVHLEWGITKFVGKVDGVHVQGGLGRLVYNISGRVVAIAKVCCQRKGRHTGTNVHNTRFC